MSRTTTRLNAYYFKKKVSDVIITNPNINDKKLFKTEREFLLYAPKIPEIII